jgi:hypothetical protein
VLGDGEDLLHRELPAEVLVNTVALNLHKSLRLSTSPRFLCD